MELQFFAILVSKVHLRGFDGFLNALALVNRSISPLQPLSNIFWVVLR
jgi:hypothetical protein